MLLHGILSSGRHRNCTSVHFQSGKCILVLLSIEIKFGDDLAMLHLNLNEPNKNIQYFMTILLENYRYYWEKQNKITHNIKAMVNANPWVMKEIHRRKDEITSHFINIFFLDVETENERDWHRQIGTKKIHKLFPFS